MADTSDSKNKRVFVNKQQKEAMVQFIENNSVLKHPPKLTNKVTKKTIANRWEELTTHLNQIGEVTGGARKDAATWKKTWVDMKSNIKKKVSETKRYELGTGGGPPLPETSENYEAKIKEMLDPMETEGDHNISESEVIFEIYEDPVRNENDSLIDCEDVPGHLKETNNQKPSVKGTITKSRRLTETLQVSNKISQEIELKTELKREYYKEKINILKENIRIKQEKLQLKKQDIVVKKEIAAALTLITQRLGPLDNWE